MDCHHASLPRDFARTAHNLSPTRLLQIRDAFPKATKIKLSQRIPGPSFSNTDVSCAVCHREHAGADASLTMLTDSQCQACHSNRFTNFVHDHPSWDTWPYRTVESIKFDHRSHGERHFPATRDDAGLAIQFDCVRCHARMETGEFSRTADYATACGTCHDKSLNQQVGERLDLLVLPSLLKPSIDIADSWPAAATGFFDGKVGPLTRWMLQANADCQQAILTLPGNGDFSRINPNDAAQLVAAEKLAIAIRDVMRAMATHGPIPGMAELDTHSAPMRRILLGLSPQLVQSATQRWFSSSPERLSKEENNAVPNQKFRMAAARESVASDDDLLSDESEGDGDLLSDPLIESNTNSPDSSRMKSGARNRHAMVQDHDPVTMQPDGGWYVDDSRMAISYRGHGHADPVLQAAIELAAGLPMDSTIRRELLGSGPTVACVECHCGVTSRGGAKNQANAWKPVPQALVPEASLTKFAHGPHMNLPSLADCKQCHSLNIGLSDNERGPIMTAVSKSGVAAEATSPHDFGPMAKQLCASCHTSAGAGDSCTKCHRYHTESSLLPL